MVRADDIQARKTPRREVRSTAIASPVPITETNRGDVMGQIRQLFSDGQNRDRVTAIRDIAAILGYQRLGTNIREILENDLRTAVRRGIVVNTNGQYTLDGRNISDYPIDHLVKMLLASIDNSWLTRAEATNATARWLGYRRTGAAISAALKSTINAAIRRGLLKRDGPDRIRRVR